MKKQDYKKFIKRINNINISNICSKNNISRQNIYDCTAKVEDIELVINELIRELNNCINLYLEKKWFEED